MVVSAKLHHEPICLSFVRLAVAKCNSASVSSIQTRTPNLPYTYSLCFLRHTGGPGCHAVCSRPRRRCEAGTHSILFRLLLSVRRGKVCLVFDLTELIKQFTWLIFGRRALSLVNLQASLGWLGVVACLLVQILLCSLSALLEERILCGSFWFHCICTLYDIRRPRVILVLILLGAPASLLLGNHLVFMVVSKILSDGS